MKLCPICGSATYFDSSLFANKCVNCNWKDEYELQMNNLFKQKEKNNLKLSNDLSETGNKVTVEIEFDVFLN